MEENKKKRIFFVLNSVFTIALLIVMIIGIVIPKKVGLGYHVGFLVAINVVNIIRFVVEAKLNGYIGNKK